MTQCEMIVAHIDKYGSITQDEAKELYGISRLASRAHDIRHKLKMPLVSERVTGKNRFGKRTSYARYYWAI